MSEARKIQARILAIDPGERRVGMAVSDELGITAQGLETFVRGGNEELLDRIGSLVEKYKIGTVLIGEPRSLSGSNIEGTERSRELAAAIRERFSVEVFLLDERMTSREAERLLRSGEKPYEKSDIDKLAAVLLLQSFLESKENR